MIFLHVLIACTLASSLQASNADEYYKLAEECKKENPQRALIFYKQALKHDPAYVNAAFSMASLYFEQQRYQDALDYFNQVIEQDPHCASALYNAAICMKNTDRDSDALTTLYKVIQINPQHLNAHLQIAGLLEKFGKPDVALATYKYILTLDPKSFDAHFHLGILERGFDHFQEAVKHLRTAVDINPNHCNALVELANALHMVGIFPECIDIYKKVLEANPNSLGVLYNYGYTLKRLGYVHEAVDIYDQVLEKKSDYALARFSRALAYLTLGDYEHGWPEYEWRWQAYNDSARQYPHIKVWNGQELAGKTILVVCEQGLGDTFQFIRYAKELKKLGAIVIVETQKPLKQLLSLCPYIDRVFGYGEVVPPAYDYQIPLMSLPWMLKTTMETVPNDFPYLYATEERFAYWKEKFASDTQFKIGICWQGNAHYSTQALRQAVALKSMNVTNFEPIAQIPGVSVYSLQMMNGADQLAGLSDPSCIKTFDGDFDNKQGRFMDTVAVMQQLDLIVTVDTSICHLAAALGCPTWVILPKPADWRWMLDLSDTPWYPTMRLFRQREFGDWSHIINDVVTELHKLLEDNA